MSDSKKSAVKFCAVASAVMLVLAVAARATCIYNTSLSDYASNDTEYYIYVYTSRIIASLYIFFAYASIIFAARRFGKKYGFCMYAVLCAIIIIECAFVVYYDYREENIYFDYEIRLAIYNQILVFVQQAAFALAVLLFALYFKPSKTDAPFSLSPKNPHGALIFGTCIIIFAIMTAIELFYTFKFLIKIDFDLLGTDVVDILRSYAVLIVQYAAVQFAVVALSYRTFFSVLRTSEKIDKKI